MVDLDKDKVSRQRHALGVVWLTVFIDLVGFSIIFPLFPAMLDWYLAREAGAGVVHSIVEALRAVTPDENQDLLIIVLFGGLLGFIYSALQFIASPFWGRLSDRHGRRHVLLITTSGTAIAYLLWVFSGSFWMLIAARLLGGMMAGNIAVATAAVADITSTANRSKGMALVGVAFGLGFIIGPAIGGLGSLLTLPGAWDTSAAIAINPFSVPALFALGLALLNVIWVWRAFPETIDPAHLTSDQQNRTKRPWFRLGSDLANVQRALRVYGIFIIAFAGMEFTLTFLALERLAYAPAQMAQVFVFVGVVLILTQGGLVRRFGHRFGERNFVTLGLLATFLGLIQLSLAIQTVPFYIGLALLGFGVGCVSPALSALVSMYSPADQQGTQLGAFRSIGALGRAIGPLLAAAAFWQLGSQVAYLVGAATLLVATAFSLLLPKPVTSAQPE